VVSRAICERAGENQAWVHRIPVTVPIVKESGHICEYEPASHRIWHRRSGWSLSSPSRIASLSLSTSAWPSPLQSETDMNERYSASVCTGTSGPASNMEVVEAQAVHYGLAFWVLVLKPLLELLHLALRAARQQHGVRVGDERAQAGPAPRLVGARTEQGPHDRGASITCRRRRKHQFSHDVAPQVLRYS